MGEELWTAVDAYIGDRLLGEDEALEAALAANAKAGLPAIDVSPAQGRLLGLLVKISGASRVLEVGTLGGYSAICMARALPPGGAVLSLEVSARHAEVARANIERAGLSERIEVRVGPAREILDALVAARAGPFDLIFIDADKPGNPYYLAAALALSRPGTMILCDNVIRGGKVVDAESADPNVEGARAAFDFVAAEPRLEATALQTVGLKGHDGLLMAVVKE